MSAPEPTDCAPPARAASRVVHCGDGVAWLEAATLGPEHAIVTSLPDVSEVPSMDLPTWRAWFVATAELACRAVADDAVTVFYQTDIKRDGRWIDKGYLVQQAAERAGSHLLWHHVVCRAAPGTITFGRPAYSHLLAFSRGLRLDPGRSQADVLPDPGAMPWVRAMGADACHAVARFLSRQTACRVVVDPFCGLGTMLAVANAHGLDAVGVELSSRRAAKARKLELPLG